MDINIFEYSYRIINKYNQKAKKPKTYGTEDLLYPAEVHMIEIIGSYEKITTTKLAQVLAVTKGAVSQTTNKLLNKGLIEKSNSPQKTNEVFITLSKSGKTVFEYHRNIHADMQRNIQEELEKLSEESILAVNKIIQIIDNSIDNM